MYRERGLGGQGELGSRAGPPGSANGDKIKGIIGALCLRPTRVVADVVESTWPATCTSIMVREAGGMMGDGGGGGGWRELGWGVPTDTCDRWTGGPGGGGGVPTLWVWVPVTLDN